jgi:hypothetical protein
VTKPGESDPARPDETEQAIPAKPATEGAPTGNAKPATEGTGTDTSTDAAEATPAHREPADSERAEPAPAQPETAQPAPAQSERAEPASAQPAPAQSEPAEAAPPKAVPARAKPIGKPVMKELDDEPVMPTAKEAALRAQAKRRFEEPPPRTLRISFYFFVASGLVWLASMVISLIYKQALIDAEVERMRGEDTTLTPDQIASGVTQILWIVLVAAATFTVFLALFGYKAIEGTRRARTLVTIFTSVLVLFHLLLNSTPPGILSALLGLTGLALLWSPSARAYFPPRELR